MSAIFRYSTSTKLRRITAGIAALSSKLHSLHPSSAAQTLPTAPLFHFHRSSLLNPSKLGSQERHKWDGSSDSYDQIKAEVDCPRCSKPMTVLFSNRPLSITAGENGIYQAVNMCYNCRTAFYFRPFKLEPLQGSFVEIGRVKGGAENFGDKEGIGGGRSGKSGPKIWEKLRSYGGGENIEKSVEGDGDGSCNVEESFDGRSNGFVEEVGKQLPTPKEMCKLLDEFVVGQQKAKKK